MLDRRRLIGRGALGLALAATPRIAFAGGESDKRLVVIVLRGAMDGLSAAPAWGDPAFEAARAGLVGDQSAVLNLDGTFALHPALAKLHARYQAKELIVLHAIASPYRDRSHFDGQNVLETGGAKPYGLPDGWLNRALGGMTGSGDRGVALSPTMPLIARGATRFTSWSPSLLPGPGPDLLARIDRLYAGDPELSAALAEAKSANGAESKSDTSAGLTPLMTAAARFLSDPHGPSAAVIDIAGWDTHANQGGTYSPLVRNLKELDTGLDTLALGLGARWADTAVVVMTEFGRTVAMNGTAGTDHGTGGVAFLVGGAVSGGRVIADWPGLGKGALLDGRDLRPTASLYAPLKAALVEHLGVDRAHVERAVFPDSAASRPSEGLFRRA